MATTVMLSFISFWRAAAVVLNDLGSSAAPAEIARGIQALVETCRRRAPKAKILLTAVFPRNDRPRLWGSIRQINAAAKRLADGKRVRFVDVNSRLADAEGRLFAGMTVDGLHLSVKGYQVWADALRPILTEILGPPAKVDLSPPPTGDPGIKGPP